MKYTAAGLLRYRQDADLAGRSVAGTPPVTRLQAFAYDALGRPTTEQVGETSCSWEQVGAIQCPPPSGAYAEWTWGGEWVVRANRYDAPTGPSIDGPEAWPYFVPVGSFAFENPRGRLVASSYFGGHVADTGGRTRHTEAFAYDAEGRVVRRRADTDGVASPVASFSYEYDRAGLLRAREVTVGAEAFRERYTHYADGSVQDAYSGAGPVGATVPTTRDARHYYNAAGAPYRTYFYGVTGGAYGFNREERRSYYVDGRLRGFSGLGNSTAPFAVRYTYTPGGLVANADTWSPVAASAGGGSGPAASGQYHYDFSYDGLGRLADAQYRVGSTPYDHFSVGGAAYDANGNVLALTRRAPTGASASAAADALSYRYTPGTNRLRWVYDGADTQAWYGEEWDANRTSFNYRPHGMEYLHYEYPQYGWGSKSNYRDVVRYDERSLPLFESYRWVDEPSTTAYRYAHVYARYDGSGRRVWRRVHADGVNTDERYVVDGGAVVGVFDGSGALKHWNTATGRLDASGRAVLLPAGHARISPGGGPGVDGGDRGGEGPLPVRPPDARTGLRERNPNQRGLHWTRAGRRDRPELRGGAVLHARARPLHLDGPARRQLS